MKLRKISVSVFPGRASLRGLFGVKKVGAAFTARYVSSPS